MDKFNEHIDINGPWLSAKVGNEDFLEMNVINILTKFSSNVHQFQTS